MYVKGEVSGSWYQFTDNLGLGSTTNQTEGLIDRGFLQDLGLNKSKLKGTKQKEYYIIRYRSRVTVAIN